jgi:hypothetical protein
MGQLIEWLKGNAAPNDYVEVSESTPLPVSQPLVTDSAPLSVKIPSELVHAGSLNGRVTLSSTPAILKIGASQLADRHTLLIHNDASAIIFIGFNSNVSSTDGYQVSSGTVVTFKFDPTQAITMYGVIDEGTASISIMEIK